MENCVIYIKLFILAVASLITGVSTISRKWYINFFVFLLCIIVETCLAYLFFPAYVFYPACASPGHIRPVMVMGTGQTEKPRRKQ